MKARPVALCVSAALLAIPLFSPAASAHKWVKRGAYQCWDENNGIPTPFNLKIIDSDSYKFVDKRYSGDRRVLGKGRWVHDDRRVRWKSGYLHNNKFRSRHRPRSGSPVITLREDSYDIYWVCTNY